MKRVLKRHPHRGMRISVFRRKTAWFSWAVIVCLLNPTWAIADLQKTEPKADFAKAARLANGTVQAGLGVLETLFQNNYSPIDRTARLGLESLESGLKKHMTSKPKPSPKPCIPWTGGKLRSPIKDYKGNPIDLTKDGKDTRPIIAVFGQGEAAKDAGKKFMTEFMGSVAVAKMAKFLSRPTLPGLSAAARDKPASDDLRILMMANLDEATQKALVEIEQRRGAEFSKVISQVRSVSNIVAPGIFNGMVFSKGYDGASAVFRDAFPGIGKGMVAKGILEGGEFEGRVEKGVDKEFSELETNSGKGLSALSGELTLAFSIDTRPYDDVPTRVDSAISTSSANTHKALYKTGLFGKTKPRGRVFNRGVDGIIRNGHNEIVRNGALAKEGYYSLKKRANNPYIHQEVFLNKPTKPLEIAIMASDGQVLASYVGDKLDAKIVAADYERLKKLFEKTPNGERAGEYNLEDRDCDGKKDPVNESPSLAEAQQKAKETSKSESHETAKLGPTRIDSQGALKLRPRSDVAPSTAFITDNTNGFRAFGDGTMYWRDAGGVLHPLQAYADGRIEGLPSDGPHAAAIRKHVEALIEFPKKATETKVAEKKDPEEVPLPVEEEKQPEKTQKVEVPAPKTAATTTIDTATQTILDGVKSGRFSVNSDGSLRVPARSGIDSNLVYTSDKSNGFKATGDGAMYWEDSTGVLHRLTAYADGRIEGMPKDPAWTPTLRQSVAKTLRGLIN